MDIRLDTPAFARRAAAPPRTRFAARLSPLPLPLLLLSAFAQAQTPAAGQGLVDATAEAPVLAPVFVTANPLGSANLTAPATALYGDALTLRQADSLGATLNGLPGVSTTTYGPMVGRPVIRGMDGDRIRLLQNGLGTWDASSLSYDHAVPQEAMSIERVEIVRGPAALLYGGNAVGGVVNTIDNRIPREPIQGVSGGIDTSFDSANSGKAGSARLEAGNGQLALHADVFDRQTDPVRIPGYARSAALRAADGGTGDDARGRLPNSDGRWHGGALGGSYTWTDGYAGLSYNGYQANYGSVAEDSVRLRMKQDHVAFASEVRNLQGPFTQVKFDAGYTDYQHREIDDGQTGTTFRNRGYDTRIEARHRKVGPFEGAVGLQMSQTTFSALGDEALVPTTRTRGIGLFGLEQWQASTALTLSLGARLDHVALTPATGGLDKFDDAQKRSFDTRSLALGSIYQLAPAWSVASNLSYTERAPVLYELYANGPHEATGQYLIGDPNAGKEKAISADLALRYASGPDKASAGVFYSRFRNYLTEFNTGRQVDDDGEVVAPGADDALAEAIYRGVRAEFYGVELEGKRRVWDQGGHQVDLELSGDYTRARNRDTGEALPRVAPLRTTVAADYRYGPYGARIDVQHAWRQGHVPSNDLPTAGYTALGVALTYKFRMGRSDWLAYLRGDNLTNQDIRYASSVVRDVAPQAGRSVKVGLRGAF